MDTWQVTFRKEENGDITVVYTPKVNLYEFITALELEKEKLKEQLLRKIT
jgi:hypothetical protein